MLRAISPVIAIIILVAVTIAIAVAVAGWMMGLWTGFTAKPALSITDAVLDVTNGNLSAIVQNSGQGDADIYSIRIGGVECVVGTDITGTSTKPTDISGKIYITSIKQGVSKCTTSNKCIIKAGDTVKLLAGCTKWQGKFTPGTSEQIVIFTKDGSKFVGTVQIVSGS